MEYPILLSFLSTVFVKNDGTCRETDYNDLGKTRTTNESAVKYLVRKKHISLNRIFAFTTTKVQKNMTYKEKDKDDGTKGAVHTYLEDGRTWTHLEYFKKRIQQDVPNVEDIVKPEPYDEKADIQANMDTVVKMAKKIQDYIDGLPLQKKDDKVVVYVDFTGGMRHANMVMLDVVRLLQYDTRVKIGEILYSNYEKGEVEEANPIYQLVDLIAGAEEFVQFGSVNSLQKYYKEKEVSAELSRVLKAMEDFAEAIRLCHYGSFTKSITDLRSSLHAFSEHMKTVEMQTDEKALNDKFMARLEGRIRESYGVLLQGTGNDKINDLDLIEWCVDNGYLQQALTLYIERVPEVIYADNKLIELTDQGEIKFKEQYNAKHDELRSPSVYLITAFKNKRLQSEIDQKLAKVYKKGIPAFQIVTKATKKAYDSIKRNGSTEINLDSENKKCLQILKKKIKEDEVFKGLKLDDIKFVNSVKDILGMASQQLVSSRYIEEAYKNVVKRDYAKKYGEQHPDELKDKSKKEQKEIKDKAAEEHIRQTYDVLSESKKVQVIFQFLAGHLTAEAAQKIFPVLYFEVASSRDIVEFIKDDEIKSNIPVSDLAKILDRYGVLKGERNHSNHARADASEFTAKTLGDEIRAGLTDLREAIQKVQ